MSLIIQVKLGAPSSLDENLALCLYIHDSGLGCGPPAALAASATVQILRGQSTVEITLNPDMSVKYAGKLWAEMVAPSMYVALDVEKSSVTYVDGPVFKLRPGSSAVLKVKPK